MIKLVIDTDAGIDDAHAILMALNRPEDVKVLGITTTHGNTNVDQVGKNVLRLLKLVNRLDIPVFQGSASSLLGNESSSSHYHGHDGFGDVPDPECENIDQLIQTEGAVNALIRLVNENVGEVTLLCLGPLTSVAVALKLDPKLGQKLHKCVIMGGNYEVAGNTKSNAEFNFSADPESVYCTFRLLRCPIVLITWELCLKCPFTWDWYKTFINADTKIGRFLKSIEAKTVREYYVDSEYLDSNKYITCDQIAAAVAIDPSVVKASANVHSTVDLQGVTTRGQMIVDWTPTDSNVELVTEIDGDLYTDMLLTVVNDMHYSRGEFMT